MDLSSPVDLYWQYLQQNAPELDRRSLSSLWQDLAHTHWDEPSTALDLNNFAVMALIAAEEIEDRVLRSLHLDLALEALEQAIEQQPGHPLCMAHLALIRHLIGENAIATQICFAALIQPVSQSSQPLGLVYLPPDCQGESRLPILLQATEGGDQALQLLAEVLWRSQMIFYSSSGLRFLHLAVQRMPGSASLHRKLGLSQLMNHQWEGVVSLQQAHQLAPGNAATLQALYLAYRSLQNLDAAAFWLQTAQRQAQKSPSSPQWQWTTVPDRPFTYVPTAEGVLLAVDASFQSIVTGVLVAEGKWFEAEMEFWLHQLQPGMIAIDVGANVGLYSFSAAQRVGALGRVLAVEPFSACLQCLQETRRINQLDWVTICAGAASDRSGTARLALHSANELNEVIQEVDQVDQIEAPSPNNLPPNFEEITCFTLDELAERENLSRLDWLKIDAEGHEMQVLTGSDRLLTQFAPAILYENVAGAGSSNRPVAEQLQARGYQLFRYQPYLSDLIPVRAIEESQGNLNLIALPPDHPLIPG